MACLWFKSYIFIIKKLFGKLYWWAALRSTIDHLSSYLVYGSTQLCRCLHALSRRWKAWKVCDPASPSFCCNGVWPCTRTHPWGGAFWLVQNAASKLAWCLSTNQKAGLAANTCVHDFNSGHWVQIPKAAVCQTIAMGCTITSSDT